MSTVIVKNATLDVDYTRLPGDPGTFVHGGGGSPPNPGTIVIHNISWTDEELQDHDVYQLIDALHMMDDVEAACWELEE